MSNSVATPFDAYAENLLAQYEPFPRGRFVSLLLLRNTESETLFRTEGNEGDVTKELTRTGLQDGKDASVLRVVMTKRKQTAVERRTGRELLRRFGLLTFVEGERSVECALNRNNPCEQCLDCYVYGYAVGGGGAQKSRVWTSDAFSLLPASAVTGRRTLNSLFDDGTMRDPESKKATPAYVPDVEYIKPETLFVDVQTLKDVTPVELTYVVGNVLRSTRYGAVSSRIGRMQNRLLAIAFSTMEGPGPLELVQDVSDRLGNPQDAPVSEDEVARQMLAAFETRVAALPSAFRVVRGDELDRDLSQPNALYRDDDRLREMLQAQTQAYPPVRG